LGFTKLKPYGHNNIAKMVISNGKLNLVLLIILNMI